MQIVHHPDIAALETHLLRTLEAAADAGPTGHRLIVLVPNTRLVDHLQHRMLRRRPAWLGVEVLQFNGLARSILERTGAPPHRPLPPALIEALVEQALAASPDGVWSRFVGARPGALRRIVRALHELREAGIPPEALASAAADGGQRHLARLHRHHLAALERLEGAGWCDETATMRAAIDRVDRAGLAGSRIWVHGAYEFVGPALDLLRSLDRVAELTVILPFGVGLPATRHAEAFARRHLCGGGDRWSALDRDDSADDRLPLEALYDETSSVRASPGRFRFRNVQGVEAEATLAARRVLAAAADGLASSEIAIVARDLQDYAAVLEELFERDELPWEGSIHAPLRRFPLIHDFLLALRAVEEGLPRRAASELLASSWIDWSRLAPTVAFPSGNHAEAWSRAARILGGLAEWREELPRWAAKARIHEEMTDDERSEAERLAQRRRAEAEAMVSVLERFTGQLAPDRLRSWDELADDLATLLHAMFTAPDREDRAGTAAREALLELLGQMRAMADSGIDRRPVSLAEGRAWLERSVESTGIGSALEAGGGVRILDLLQARGMTFERVIWIGLDAGRFPRPPREDPVLDDDLRQTLRHRTGRPLAVRGEAADEERLLLALTLGAARDSIEISWQRADDDGKARSPSLALREIARLACGEPHVERIAEPEEHRLPSHPRAWLEALAADSGMLTTDESLLLTALRAGESGPRALESLREPLGAGIDMLLRTESFAPAGAEYDGAVGALGGSSGPHSVTALETLGRCPLQYLFRFVVRIREPDEEIAAWSATPREIGIRVHEQLERLYRAIDADGLLRVAEAGERARRIRALVRESWTDGGGPLDLRLRRRLPVLWSQQLDAWSGAIERFLVEDLDRLVAQRLRFAAFEEPAGGEIDLGEGIRIEVRGRFDRRLRGQEVEWIGDYKTSGNLEARANVTSMLKGQSLQVPLYRLIAGDRAGIELLGVGPRFDPEAHDQEPKHRHVRFEGFANERERAGLLETLRVLLELVDRGRFPLHPDSGVCEYCAYAAACRRNHPPTVDRERRSADTRDFYLLKRKNKQKRPLLADLTEAERGEGQR